MCQSNQFGVPRRYEYGQKCLYIYMLRKLAKMLNIETEQPGYQRQHKLTITPLSCVLFIYHYYCVKKPNMLKKFSMFENMLKIFRFSIFTTHMKKFSIFHRSSLIFIWPSHIVVNFLRRGILLQSWILNTQTCQKRQSWVRRKKTN